MAKAEFIRRKCRLKGVYSNGHDSFEWKTYNPDVPITTTPFTRQSSFQQPSNQQVVYQQQPKDNYVFIVALIFAIVALIFSFLPIIGIPHAIVAIILSIIGLASKDSDKVKSGVALGIAVVAIIIGCTVSIARSRNKNIKPSEQSVVVVSDSSQTTSVKNSVPVEEITEKWKKDGVVDYPDVNEFEQAVNNGEELAGKTVTFTVKGVRPDSILGYNLYGGEHLNFVSDEGIGINEGDEITVIVTDVKRVLTDSYKISYVLLDRKSK